MKDHLNTIALSPLVVKARGDRYASNAIPWSLVMAYSKLIDVPLFHICDSNCNKFRETIVHNCLLDFCQPNLPPPNSVVMGLEDHENGVTALAEDLARVAPPPELLQHLGIISRFRLAYESKYGPRLDPPCIVHCRLDDVKEAPNREYQKRIEDDRLLKLLKFLHKKHDRIHIETTPHDVELMELLVQQLDFKVQVEGHADIDESIWVMANASPLILSRSNFSIFAGLLNQNPVFSYEPWIHFNQMSGSSVRSNREMSRHLLLLDWE